MNHRCAVLLRPRGCALRGRRGFQKRSGKPTTYVIISLSPACVMLVIFVAVSMAFSRLAHHSPEGHEILRHRGGSGACGHRFSPANFGPGRFLRVPTNNLSPLPYRRPVRSCQLANSSPRRTGSRNCRVPALRTAPCRDTYIPSED